MHMYLYFAAFALLLWALLYLLYRRGILSAKRVRAILFQFHTGSGGDRASLDACTGWVRHPVHFRESRTYTLTMDLRLSAGEAEVSLLDRDRRQLLRLNRHTPTGAIELDGRSRYFLHWTFQSASGQCQLRWLLGSL